MATRIAYAVLLLFNSIFAWIMLTPWAIRKLEHLTLDYMTFECGTSECYGYMAVQRYADLTSAVLHLRAPPGPNRSPKSEPTYPR